MIPIACNPCIVSLNISMIAVILHGESCADASILDETKCDIIGCVGYGAKPRCIRATLDTCYTHAQSSICGSLKSYTQIFTGLQSSVFAFASLSPSFVDTWMNSSDSSQSCQSFLEAIWQSVPSDSRTWRALRGALTPLLDSMVLF